MPYATIRGREYLTQQEVSDLITATGSVGLNRLRDTTLILVSYRHGLRVSEATDLRWEQVDFRQKALHVRRLKNGSASTHPLGKEECHNLEMLRRLFPDATHVFTSKSGSRLTRSAIYQMVARAGRLAKIPFTELSPERFRGFWKD